jgi:hypothetical protein
MMCVRLKYPLIFLSALGLLACGPQKPSKEYPGNWHNEINSGILRTLLAHRVTGCGQLAYKPAYDNEKHTLTGDAEYLVYCNDGEQKTAYVVFVRPGKEGDVIGPASLYDDIPPPTYWDD